MDRRDVVGAPVDENSGRGSSELRMSFGLHSEIHGSGAHPEHDSGQPNNGEPGRFVSGELCQSSKERRSR